MTQGQTEPDHPVDGAAAPSPSRRQFARWAGLTGALAALAGGWAIWRARQRRFPRVAVASVDEIPVGGTKIFTYPADTDPCILLRPSAATFVAYSRLCTHTGCPVFYEQQRNIVYCPCHGGAFRVADGSVIEGPPPRPLPRILLEQDGTDLVAIGVSEPNS